MGTVNLGRVGLVPKGDYSADVQYERNDIVTYNSSAYAALRAVKGIAPSNDGVNFVILVDNSAALEAATEANSAAQAANLAANNYAGVIGNGNLNTTEQTLKGAINEHESDLKKVAEQFTSMGNGKIDGAYVEDGYLYMTANGEVVVGPLGPFSGTGGSGGGSSNNNAVLTVTNTTGWLSKSIATGSSCVIALNWTSLEDGIATGNGSLAVSVNGVSKLNRNVEQGDVSVDVSSYLTTEESAVKVTLSDVYGNSRTITYTVTTISVSLASAFDASGHFTGSIDYFYTPVGNIDKVVHFLIDGKEIGTAEVSTSGRQQTYTIPAQTHGAHTLRVFFTAMVDEQEITSNDLYYDLACVEDGNTTPIITSTFRTETAEQYTMLQLPWRVYNPASLTAAVKLRANGKEVSDLPSVDRTEQLWEYRPTEVGDLLLEIVCGDVVKPFTLNISKSTVQVEAETQNLDLYLTSYGRTNIEANPAVWENNGVSAVFSDFNFVSDGWLRDSDNNTVLRVTGDARLEIPLKVFAQDFRSTGKTIEIEFATRDVRDYDAVIMSCMSGGRGFEITAQQAKLTSEQSSIGTQYKEDEHIRLSFVVEKRSGNRLLLIYLNGILSGIKQYADDDDFSQASPVSISVGSNMSTIDLYNIRVYSNDLTRYQILDNWIADTQEIGLKVDRYNRNNIFDAYGAIVASKLPSYLPYLVITCGKLPQYKGDKQTCSGYYVNPLHPEKSFVFVDAVIDVQGTSSQYYYVKNYKISFKNGFEFEFETSEVYAMNDEAIPTDTFTMKADVASSEGANNVELVRLYNEISPHRTPPQAENQKVRQGIDGFPIVIFWDNGTEVSFLGKYNFNNDKGTPEVFGFGDADESWEIKNNVSDRVMWKSDDFSGTAWQNDFEARHPEDNTDVTKLASFSSWIVSTDRTAATGEELVMPVTYGDVEYINDTADYRLAKFVDELADYADVDSAAFYYLFTELFLLVDSRAKNAFPTRFNADGKWCWLPYDMDTALGTNNEGALVFDYSLEDTDYLESGAEVFNGQQSVFWNNVRDGFGSYIADMYKTLRSEGTLSYEVVDGRFEDHQSKWPEAVVNEDAFRKGIEPYEKEGSTIYFDMQQGLKTLQRKWWLFNRFRYFDAKHDTGDVASDYILLRIYSEGDVGLKPYADTYLRTKLGSYIQEVRAKRGTMYTLPCLVDRANDLETTLFPASLISEISDLSPLMVGQANFAPATKLQVIKLGDASESYSNGNLTSLTFGPNYLLRIVDVRNCPNLVDPVDMSNCTNLEEAYYTGTNITGLSLPNGGVLKILHLPNSIKNLTILNQKKITEFVLGSYSQIETLRLENVSAVVDSAAILNQMAPQMRVRLIGVAWELADVDAIEALYDHLDSMRGLDENGANVDRAQISGTIHVPAISTEEIRSLKLRYPDINITADAITYTVNYYDGVSEDPIYTAYVVGGNAAPDPVAEGLIDEPYKEAEGNTAFKYIGWDVSLDNITADTDITAQYEESAAWVVTFLNYDDSVLYTTRVADGGTVRDPVAAGLIPTPSREPDSQYVYTYMGWSGSLVNITSERTLVARYSTASSIKVTFANYDGTTLYTAYCTYGGGVPDPITAGLIDEPTRPDNESSQLVYTYAGWDKTFTAVTAATTVTATYTSKAYYIAKFVNYDSTELYSCRVWKNGSVSDPVEGGLIEAPTKPAGDAYGYIFKGWSPTLSTNMTANVTYTAQYKTDQVFTVLFVDYDGTTVLDTQYVSDEDAAVEPVSAGRIGTPLRASTSQYTYTWSGWSGNYSKITDHTTITATYTQTTRTYTVRFWDGSNLMATVDGVAYNGTATYPGTPTKTGVDNPGDYLFNGWTPSNTSIVGDTDCYAAWLTSTIEDSWAEIFAAIDDGSYATKYAVGDTKALDLGSEGMVFMQIAAIDKDTKADGSGKAPISWLSQQLLATSRRMGPKDLVTNYTYPEVASWTGSSNTWTSQNRYNVSDAVATWKITAEDAQTLTVSYKTSNGTASRNTIDVTVNGEAIATDYASTTAATHSVELAAGDIVEIGATYSLLSASYNYYGTVTFSSTGTFSVDATVENAPNRVIDSYESGTGTIGGWEVTELRSVMQETIMPLIPEEVRNRIVPVTKTHTAYDTAGKSFTQSTTDSVWIPDYNEVFSSSGLYYSLFPNQSSRVKKKVGASSGSSWWLRSAYVTSHFANVNHSGNFTNGPSWAYGLALGFCT